MAALNNTCNLYSIPGFKFQPIDDFTVDEEYSKYYPCWDGKVLFISLTSDDKNIKQKYQEAIIKHNNSLEDNEYPDAGFDVFVPEKPSEQEVKATFKIDFNIKCAMFNKLRGVKSSNKSEHLIYDINQPLGFYMYPRSSISKTHLRLANNVGIIDSGYRGNLGGFFDIHNLPVDENPYEQYQRLVQICSNTLEPFKVILVDDIDKLGTTERGEGGFGSTGV
jgi:dUTP pyrophosphatase